MIRRWMTNSALAVLAGAAWIVAVLALSLVSSPAAARSISDLLPSLFYGLFELAFFGAVPLLVYLVIGEALWTRVPRPRLVSILLGAAVVAVPLAYSVGGASNSPGAVATVLAFAGVGATYGAIARLPPLHRPV